MKRDVKVKEGLRLPFPVGVKASPGRRTFILEGDEVITVDDTNLFVRRRIKKGDLVVQTTKAAKKPAKPKTTKKPERSE